MSLGKLATERARAAIGRWLARGYELEDACNIAAEELELIEALGLTEDQVQSAQMFIDRGWEPAWAYNLASKAAAGNKYNEELL